MKNMKFKILLIVFVNLMMVTALFAQEDIMVIEGGQENGGIIETTINGDTTSTGDRVNPNRIYELKAGQYYLQHAGINVDNPDGTITIRGQEGGPKPVIIKMPLEEIAVSPNNINSSLVLQNIQYHNMETNNNIQWAAWKITGDNHHLTLENNLFENIHGMLFNMNNVQKGAEIYIKNNYFRDSHNFAQWWGGRVVQCKVPVDVLMFENNTTVGCGLTVLAQESLIEYAVINHNTFINNIKYPFLNQYWKEVYFTNNLWINANMVGEDKENVATGGQDPDALLHGISGVDTITNTILVQDKFLNPDGSLTDEVDEISDYIYYAADNVVTYSATLDNYYSGGLSPDWDDAPSSYLTWGGVEGPFKVVNVPGIWSNSRTNALIADHSNIVDENNSIYEMRTADLGLVTDPLPQDAADVFIQWNRNQWGVPGVEKPTDFSAFQMGDYNPLTIPGVETENSKAGGITKISDMIEDFSYSKSLISKSDGLRIGALHWNDEEFDSEASLAAVKSAYNVATDVEDILLRSSSDIINYPNPFNGSTTIRYNLQKDTHVLLSVFDISGRLVEVLVNENKLGGTHDVQFTPRTNANSTFFYKLTTNDNTLTGKMIYFK